MSQSRQLAAIMFTDIVGYTALMGKDERKAFEFLNKNRQIQKPIIEEYNGRFIKELGDGILASFSTMSDAVAAAIKIQQACNASKEFRLRIGIHLGEVIFENDDVFGDGVNIASRIQAIAQPGSIFISETVYKSISNKREFNTKFFTEQKLKNVKDPVRIYQVIADGVTVAHQQVIQKIKPKRNVVLLAVSILIILVATYFFKGGFTTQKNPQQENPDITIDKSIAVLPFVNMSADSSQEYFSDGLSEELLNLLAKIPELKVIGRTSSFAFKGKNEDLRTIAQKLGVAHLLEGSVRRDGNKIRVTAQLIKALDGSHMWSDTYDRQMDSIFKLQDEIAQDVVEQLKLKLLQAPTAKKSGTGNIEAYNLLLQGNYFLDKLDKENVAKAVELYHKALAIDSTDARVWSSLANAMSRQSWQNYIEQQSGYEKARAAALKAISLDSTNVKGHQELGDIKLYHDFDWDGAEQAYLKAYSLDPTDAEVLISLGDHKNSLGRCREAEQFYKKALTFNPLKPIIYLDLGNSMSCDGRFAEATTTFGKILEIDPGYQRAHMYIGRNYLLMGKPELALKEIEQENMEIFKTFGLALAYHALGNKKNADEMLKNFTDNYQNSWAYLLAQLHAFRGEKDAAFEWLEIAYKRKDSWLFWLKADPLLKNLEDDPRHKSFLQKMNLP